MAALDTMMVASPYEAQPAEIRSPDGRVYLHRGFYRNHRQCGTFNGQPLILSEAPAEKPDRMNAAICWVARRRRRVRRAPS